MANCMLLTAAENGAGGKSDTPPDEWFKDKIKAYLDRHLIPRDQTLWKLDRFEDFIAERKKLIKAKFTYLLSVRGDSKCGSIECERNLIIKKHRLQTRTAAAEPERYTGNIY